jgi:hypothetical protein
LDLGAMIMVNICADGIKIVKINSESLRRLKRKGWIFVPADSRPTSPPIISISILNCVGFAKAVLGIRNIFIFTPLQLYKYLSKSSHE